MKSKYTVIYRNRDSYLTTNYRIVNAVNATAARKVVEALGFIVVSSRKRTEKK